MDTPLPWKRAGAGGGLFRSSVYASYSRQRERNPSPCQNTTMVGLKVWVQCASLDELLLRTPANRDWVQSTSVTLWRVARAPA